QLCAGQGEAQERAPAGKIAERTSGVDRPVGRGEPGPDLRADGSPDRSAVAVLENVEAGGEREPRAGPRRERRGGDPVVPGRRGEGAVGELQRREVLRDGPQL